MKINKNTSLSLSKYLAQAGIASRRKVIDIIKSKAVTVNDSVVTEPGYKLSSQDRVKINNEEVKIEDKIYILLNKPKNCITTVSDEKDRHNVLDLIGQDIKERIYPVGRLDRNTTGLLLLTNDGELAQKLAHPRFEIEKVYHVHLDKPVIKSDIQKMLSGVHLEDGIIKVDEAYYAHNQTKKKVIVILHSGKNRIVRRIFQYLGYEVTQLDRIGYAGLTKNSLKRGQWRFLTNTEIIHLKKS